MNIDEIQQQVLDEYAIRQTLLRYCRAIDRCDAELLLRCYHEDAHDEHGPFVGGRDAFVEHALGELRARSLSHGQITTHLLGNVIADIDGDGADVESYFRSAHVEDRDDHFRVFEFNGRYLDYFERRNGEWRISRRVVVHDWSEIRNHRRGLLPGSHPYRQGELWPVDVVYAR